jgi:flagellar export protein FliJ
VPALPPYRLATLLDIRQRKKEQAEHYLAECLAELKRQQDRLEALEMELVRMEERRQTLRRTFMDKAMAGEVGAQAATQHNTYIEHLKDQEKRQAEAIAEQKDVVKEKEAVVADARAQLLARTQELKALEKHREKWLEDIKKEIAAKEELVMDDIAQTIYLRGQAEAVREAASRPPPKGGEEK